MKKIVFILIVSIFLFQRSSAVFADEPQLRKDETKVKQDTAEDSLKERAKFNKLSRSNPQIYKATMRSNVVYRLQTALGYVSTIDLPEPALKVFIGDQELFKAGVYEREVLIKPITDYPEASTNLTIMTATGRLTFNVTVGPPNTADFVIDFRLPEEDVLVENAFKKALDEKSNVIKKEYEEKEKTLDQKVNNLARTKLKEEVAKAVQTVDIGTHQEVGDIRLNLISSSKIGGKVYLRFGVRNLSATPYKVSKVVVGIEPYGRKTLGLRKEPEGLIELPSELQFPSEVPVNDYVYGVIVFDGRALARKERPVFLLFEDGGNRNFKMRGFRWIN